MSMPADRRPSANTGRPQRAARPARPGQSEGRSAGKSGDRPDTRRAGPPRSGSASRSNAAGKHEPRRYGDDGQRSGPPRRDPRATPVEDGERSRRYGTARPQSGARSGGRDRVPPRRVAPPKTTAQIRSAEVKATRALRDSVREPRQQAEPAPWERETWIDNGPLRSEARKATERAKRPERVDDNTKQAARRKSVDLAPEVAEDLQRAAPAARGREVSRAVGDRR